MHEEYQRLMAIWKLVLSDSMQVNVICRDQLLLVDATVRSAMILTLCFRGVFHRPGCQDFVMKIRLFFVTSASVDVKP